MKKLINFLLVLAVILSGGLLFFLLVDFKKNSKKLKSLAKNARRFAEDSTDWVQDNGFGEMGWSDLDWTNDEILKRKKDNKSKAKNDENKKEQTKEVESITKDLQTYLSKVEEPVKEVARKIEKSSIVKKLSPVNKTVALKSSLAFNDRQDRIISMIKDKRKLNMGEIASKFPDITSRTLRRDMEKLEKLKVTKQIGKTRDSYYVLV
ncbi:MAG: DeoR family transcriptional regulator [Candidatus Dojkabacteria bacterium]